MLRIQAIFRYKTKKRNTFFFSIRFYPVLHIYTNNKLREIFNADIFSKVP